MTKLLIVKHDGGAWAWEVNSDDSIRRVLAEQLFDPGIVLSPEQQTEVEATFRTLADDHEVIGEQWSVELHIPGGFGDLPKTIEQPNLVPEHLAACKETNS